LFEVLPFLFSSTIGVALVATFLVLLAVFLTHRMVRNSNEPRTSILLPMLMRSLSGISFETLIVFENAPIQARD
jgi:hypothetical protein